MDKILLIEDETSISDVYKEALEDKGFKVEQAYNGKEGLTKALEGNFGVIILDLLLPVKDGFDFLYEYMNQKNDPAPIIVLSNLNDFGSKLKAYKKGIVSYMVKANTSMDELIDKVASVVS